MEMFFVGRRASMATRIITTQNCMIHRANTWTIVPGSQSPNFNYSDSPAELLPNGNVLVSDSQSTFYIYNAAFQHD